MPVPAECVPCISEAQAGLPRESTAVRAPSVYRLGPGSGLVRCHTRTTGKGKFTWADGSTYVGFYVADKREGKGEAAYAN